jgi:hypothetical protein
VLIGAHDEVHTDGRRANTIAVEAPAVFAVDASTVLDRCLRRINTVEELSHTPIPKKVWPEILGMSLEGRKALADYLEQEAPA